tara:strand:+ start:916 stop:1137 length:222 start_codon:yes stop_codon:yes gene_type:complete
MIGSFLKAKKEDVRIPLFINNEEIGEAVRFAVKEIDGTEYIEIIGRFNIHVSDEILKSIVAQGIFLGKTQKTK